MVRGKKVEIVSLLVLVIVMAATAATVTYDHRALVIDGKRKILISGSIHYPRSTPEVTTLLHIYTYIRLRIYINVTYNNIFLEICIFFSELLFLDIWCRCGQTLYRNQRTVAWTL